MRVLRVLMLSVLVALLFAPIYTPLHAAPAETRTATLTGFEEVPPISTRGTGTLRITISSGVIEFELTYSNMTSAVLFAHIHFGQLSVNGGVIAFLCGGGSKPACPASPATVVGTIVPADIIGPTGQGIAAGEFGEALRAIRAGASYGNVHTETFPSGEIRGQL